MARYTGRRPTGAVRPTPGTAADETPDADPVAVAKSILLRQLTVSARSRAQLADALARRGVDDDVAAAVLDRFTEVGLVDDASFAQSWVRSRQQTRLLAPRALAGELRERGISADLVEQALEQVTPEDELAAARALVRRKLASTAGDDPARRFRRLVGVLARKGYAGGVAMTAIRAELAEEAEALLDDEVGEG